MDAIPDERPRAETGSRGRSGVLLLVLGLCGFASSLTMRSVDPMLPLVSAEFGITAHQAALLASAYALTYALGLPVMGALGDAYGKALTITVCLALLACGLFASMTAPDFPTLLAIRAATGLAGGAIIPLSLALIGDRFEVAIRQVALGRFLFVSISGQMVGAAASGIVAEAIGWRGVFAASGVVAAAIAVLALLVLRRRPGAARRPFGIAPLIANNTEVLRSRGALAFYAVVLVEGLLVFASPPFVAAFLFERDGISPSGAGLVLGAIGLGTVAYTLLVGPLLRRLGTGGLRLWGGLSAGLALALFALALPVPLPALLFFGVGFGFMMLHNTLQMTATELAPRLRGTALGLFAMSFFLGQSVGPILFGQLSEAAGMQAALVCSGALLAALGVVAAFVIRRA